MPGGIRIRNWIALLSLLAFTVLAGCSFTMGRQKVRLVPGTGTAPRSVESGDGERIYLERPAPEGDTFFLFLRGQL